MEDVITNREQIQNQLLQIKEQIVRGETESAKDLCSSLGEQFKRLLTTPIQNPSKPSSRSPQIALYGADFLEPYEHVSPAAQSNQQALDYLKANQLAEALQAIEGALKKWQEQ